MKVAGVAQPVPCRRGTVGGLGGVERTQNKQLAARRRRWCWSSEVGATLVDDLLYRHDMVGSMGRVGAAGDNAAMESFFSLLQKNVVDRRRGDTREELRIAIITWIERTYHRRRRQAALGRLTPIEFEAIMTTPASQAA